MRTSTTNVYQISSIRQLVDLNQDMINFNIDFHVKSENGEAFECLVIDQQTLDSEETLQYKKVPGVINGSVSSYKNIYQSYYLILRADEPCNVEVTLNIERLEDNLPLNDPQPIVVPEQQVMMPDGSSSGVMKWLKNWKILFAIGVIVAVIIYIYMSNKKPKEPTIVTMFYPRKVEESKPKDTDIQISPPPQPPVIEPKPIPHKPPVGTGTSTETESKPAKPGLDFANRLKSLKIDGL